MLTTILLLVAVIVGAAFVAFAIGQAKAHDRIRELEARPAAPAIAPPKRKRTNRKALLEGRLELQGKGEFAVAAVGESHYQDALRAVVGRTEYGRTPRSAVLICEDDNRHDRNAVRVEIDGRLVAYLSREHAVVHREILAEHGYAGAQGVCRAVVVGGGGKSFGVWLDL